MASQRAFAILEYKLDTNDLYSGLQPLEASAAVSSLLSSHHSTCKFDARGLQIREGLRACLPALHVDLPLCRRFRCCAVPPNSSGISFDFAPSPRRSSSSACKSYFQARSRLEGSFVGDVIEVLALGTEGGIQRSNRRPLS